MKRLIIFLVTFISFQTVYSQDAVGLAQLFLGIQGVGNNETVTHNIESMGTVWEESNDSFVISYDFALYNSSDSTIGNTFGYFDKQWAEFNWSWESGGYPIHWGLGLYKITNSKVSGKYFYLDTRDNAYVQNLPGDNPDVWFVYRTDSAKYQCIVKCNSFIENGSLVRVSDILGFTSKTDKLESVWANALVLVNNGNNRPKLIWGKYPTSNVILYQIYRDDSGNGNYTIIATVSNTTFTYTDNSVVMGEPGQVINYKVKAFGKEFTNTVSTTVIPYKKGTESESEINYSLTQNYPNPFNPLTVISFSIPKNSFVSLKVFDVLGNEVSELVNEIKEKGNYNISFEASNLSSGVYFYTLKANGNSLTKKMLLAK